MLPATRSEPDAWLVPLLAAALLSVVFMSPGATDPGTRSTMIFVLVPMLSMSGVFARSRGYLHARERTTLISFPIAAQEHLRAAVRLNLQGLAYVAALSLLAVLGTAALQGLAPEILARQGMECALLFICAAGLEPLVFAIGADLGRDFDEQDPRGILQRQISGGWTAPQAAIHLYTPAASVLGAAALAMVPQLAVASAFEGQRVSAAAIGMAAILPAAVLLAAVAWTQRIYERGYFEAVPWLMQSVRTLAGPPVPEALPPWITAIRHPVRRLLLLQWLRLTPVPRLRVVLLLLWIGWAITRGAVLSAPAIAVGVCLTMVWLVPNRALAREARQRMRALGHLPVPSTASEGREPLLTTLAWIPAVTVALIIVRHWIVASAA